MVAASSFAGSPSSTDLSNANNSVARRCARYRTTGSVRSTCCMRRLLSHEKYYERASVRTRRSDLTGNSVFVSLAGVLLLFTQRQSLVDCASRLRCSTNETRARQAHDATRLSSASDDIRLWTAGRRTSDAMKRRLRLNRMNEREHGN